MVIKIDYTSSDVYVSTSVSPVYVVVNYSGTSGGGVWGQITGTLSDQTDLQDALDDKVPYTGATGNVDLGEYELKAGQFEFDQSPTGTAGVGVMRWNDTDGTLDLGLKGGNVTLQLGQELVQRVVNKSGANLLESAYQVVKVTDAQGQRLAVDLAQGNNDANSTDTLGIVTETINNNQEGFITTSGIVRNINTTGSLQGETWADGDIIYLSPTTAGAITKVKPVAPQHSIILGYVVYAHNVNGKIFVKVDNGYELDELHNVAISSATDNQVLTYEASTSLWKNKTPTTGGDNIYTADGTLTGNRIINTANSYTLTLNPTLIQGATFKGYVNKTITSGYGTTTSFNNILASDVDATYTGNAFTDLYGTYHSAYITNSGAGGNSLVRARGYYAELATRGQTASSYIGLVGFESYVARRDASDISTNANNTLTGFVVNVSHVFSSDASIYSGFVYGNSIGIINNAGTMNLVYGNLQNLTLSTTSNAKNSLVSNYYAFYSQATIGRASGPTGTVTNYYGLYLNTPTVNATGTITNRWGIYAPDVAMNHYINGTLLLGTTSPSTYKLDVNGTARVSGDFIVTENLNNPTSVTISNSTNSSSAEVYLELLSNTASGSTYIGKRSTSSTPASIIGYSDFYIGNNVAGNISILNNVSTGTIRLSAGAATTPQLTLTAAGLFLIGTTTDDGSTRLQVSGDASVSGVLRETVTTNRQTSSYSVVLTDRGKLVEMNVASANNLTVPLNSSIAFPVGTKIDIAQYGAGQTTVVATGGVTIRSAGGALKLAAQYSGATLVKIGTDEWYLFGNITT